MLVWGHESTLLFEYFDCLSLQAYIVDSTYPEPRIQESNGWSTPHLTEIFDKTDLMEEPVFAAFSHMYDNLVPKKCLNSRIITCF